MPRSGTGSHPGFAPGEKSYSPARRPTLTTPDRSSGVAPLVVRFEWHYTPKHGSWLNMAESELGVLAKQCLDRRLPDMKTLATEVKAWQSYRNKHHATADWQFTTRDARVKLKHLYPVF
jgi:hypothetical protein